MLPIRGWCTWKAIRRSKAMLTLLLFLQSARDQEFTKQASESTKAMFSDLWRFWVTELGFLWVLTPFVGLVIWAMIAGERARRRDKKNYKRDHPFDTKLGD
jgi:hypothetical protein